MTIRAFISEHFGNKEFIMEELSDKFNEVYNKKSTAVDMRNNLDVMCAILEVSGTDKYVFKA